MVEQESDGTTEWADVVEWTHAWDMADAVTYEDDGMLWQAFPATRIDMVSDRGIGTGTPLRRDQGPWGRHLCTRGVIPGPIYVAESKRFNGRPAMFADPLQPDGPWEFAASGLMTCDDPVDKSMWFNAPDGYPQPYLAAILCRVPNGVERWWGAWDAVNGHIGTTTTIGHHSRPRKKKQAWGVTTSILIGDPWPTTDVEGNEDQTLLVLVRADGENSFLELNWRGNDAKTETYRSNFTLARRTAKEIFFGYAHASYVTAAGLKVGEPTEAEIDRIRDWSVQWMPPTAPLPLEPALGQIGSP